MDSLESNNSSPSVAPLSLDSQIQQNHSESSYPTSPTSPKSPKSHTPHTPKSPKSPKTEGSKLNRLEVVSPLLLATEITPITSREEDYSVLYSDSDGASQNSTKLRTSKKRVNSASKRRKSDGSDARSGRSARSGVNQRDKIPQTTKIFRNLLILEESLRQQSKDQRNLRRKFTGFIAILAGLEGFTVYSLYFVVVPPSPVVKIILQFLMLFILVTLFLYQLSGEYNRTIVIPRKFFNSTNKGLRQLNLRLVKVKSPISQKFVDFWRIILRSVVKFILAILEGLSFLQSIGFLKVTTQKLKNLEIRAQPRIGVTDVKLVLNPRGFNSEIREAWEVYRDEFWVRKGSQKIKNADQISSNLSSASVLDKNSFIDKHRKQRKGRRKSKLGDDPLSSSGEINKEKAAASPHDTQRHNSQ